MKAGKRRRFTLCFSLWLISMAAIGGYSAVASLHQEPAPLCRPAQP
jgi:hypothetical protein